MRFYSTWFLAAVTLLVSTGAHAAAKGGNDIWLQIIRLIAPGI